MRRLRTLPDGVQRRRRLHTIQVLPTLVTAGNLVAGLLCIAYLQDAAADPEAAGGLLVKAAWLIFIGMLCDAADGRIARLTGTSSGFGAQLDSLADIVTFGVAPALLAKTVVDAAVAGGALPPIHGRVLFALGVVYVIGAALRLARYNVESDRTGAKDGKHVTVMFSGLPSPAAAGVIASLVLVHDLYAFLHGIEWALLLLTPLLGFLMISRLPYVHIANRYLDGRRPLATVIVLVLLVFFMVSFFEETVAAGFLAYAVSGLLLGLVGRLLGRDWTEEHDLEDDEDTDDGVIEEIAAS